MTIFQKIKINFFIVCLTCAIVSASDVAVNFQDVACQENGRFTRKNSPIFLKCYYAKSCSQAKLALRSFEIRLRDDETMVVGKIGTKYIFDSKQIYIGDIEVDQKYQGNGYGTEALRTVLGIYRGEKNSHLNFDHFFLTVGLGSDRAAARHIYEKLNFQVVESFYFGYQNMRCER